MRELSTEIAGKDVVHYTKCPMGVKEFLPKFRQAKIDKIPTEIQPKSPIAAESYVKNDPSANLQTNLNAKREGIQSEVGKSS